MMPNAHSSLYAQGSFLAIITGFSRCGSIQGKHPGPVHLLASVIDLLNEQRSISREEKCSITVAV